MAEYFLPDRKPYYLPVCTQDTHFRFSAAYISMAVTRSKEHIFLSAFLEDCCFS